MGVYDEPLGLPPRRWKGEQPGDTIRGTVTSVVRLVGTQFNAEKIGLAYVLETADGKQDEFTAWNAVTKQQLADLRPGEGDELEIEFLGVDPNAPNPAMAARQYRIEVLERANPFHGLEGVA